MFDNYVFFNFLKSIGNTPVLILLLCKVVMHLIDNNIQVVSYLLKLMGTEILQITVPNISLNSVGIKNKTRSSILDSIHVNNPKGETETYYNISNLELVII
jgi:hypothetical protein